VHQPQLASLFPQAARFESHVPEVVLDWFVIPMFHFVARILFWFRLMQQGSVQIYLVYVFAIPVVDRIDDHFRRTAAWGKQPGNSTFPGLWRFRHPPVRSEVRQRCPQ
jgi:hypothetical protein